VADGRPEEGRYQALRAAWGPDPKTINRKFYFFFLSQGVLNVLLSLPFLLIAFNPSPALHPLEWAAAALWGFALLGEGLADSQLKAFKARAAAAGRHGEVCKAGLWRYSRHPNYFCEWLIWCAYALLALTSPYGYLAWISPAIILYLLLKVTGIPPTEAQSLRSRGEAYRRYQEETSAFFPWFPKRPT
jgi:steroid 5-alpha reductase family enzyme